MARYLDVYFHRRLAGRLIQDEHGQMLFQYEESWLSDPGAIALSRSLPLRSEAFSRNECRGFFGGILPEETQREIVARNLGISARNDFAMLEQIGGECAGAVTFIPAGENLPDYDQGYRKLTEAELAKTLSKLPRHPLMAGEDGIRLSLAGAQSKLAVRVADNEISIPLGAAPSTHILKPAAVHFEGLIFNEAFCMKLAHAIGLNVANVEVGRVEEIDYILVERYDRRTVQNPVGAVTERLHQEDFCQALAIISESKYQNEGGPSLKQSFDLVRGASSAPVIDLQRLLNAVIFNFLIGNHDAHGKNFSLLYVGERTEFAPLYDLVSTVHYPELSKKMAMKIGGEYESDRVFPRHFERFAEDVGLSKPIVRRRVPEMATAILSKLSHVEALHPVSPTLAGIIRDRCGRTIRRFGD